MDRKDGNSLAELMAELGKLEGLHWMRILYAYPSYFSDALIDEIASNPKVCPIFAGFLVQFLHGHTCLFLPLQA